MSSEITDYEIEYPCKMWKAVITGIDRGPGRQPYALLRPTKEQAKTAAERQLQYHDIDSSDWHPLFASGDGVAMSTGDEVFVRVVKAWLRNEENNDDDS